MALKCIRIGGPPMHQGNRKMPLEVNEKKGRVWRIKVPRVRVLFKLMCADLRINLLNVLLRLRKNLICFLLF